MRRVRAWAIWGLGGLFGLLLLVLTVVLAAANTQAGRDWIEATAVRSSGGKVQLSGLSGRFPDGLRLGRIEMRDELGAWLVIEDLALDWSPRRLLVGEALIDRLEATHIVLDRLPPSSPEEEPSTSGTSLPVAVRLQRLRVGWLDLGEAVAGKAASLSLDGEGHLASLSQGAAALAIRRLDGQGDYSLQGRYEDGAVDAHLAVAEPAQGLIASFAGIEELDALSAEAEVNGPLSALQARLDLSFGPLRATAQGKLDLDGRRIETLNIAVTAPAMRPRPDLAWQAVALEAKATGPFNAPSAAGTLRIDRLAAADAAVHAIVFNLQGDAGQVRLEGTLEGIRIPGPKPDLLEAQALKLDAGLRLDSPDRPLKFSLKHPLLEAEGKAELGGDLAAEVALNLTDLKPLAAMGGQDVRGRAGLNLHLAQQSQVFKLGLDGLVAVTGGQAPWPRLLGEKAKLNLAVSLDGPDIRLQALGLEGRAVGLSVVGALAAGKADFRWTFALNDLAAVLPQASGRLAGQGRVAGPLDKFAVVAEFNGEIATQQWPRGPIKAQVALDGLPQAPSGRVTAQGVLGGSPLDLVIAAEVPADASVRVRIERADWKSAKGTGEFSLPKESQWPLGKMTFRVGQLADLRPLLVQPVQGSLSLDLETLLRAGRPLAQLRLEARQAGLAGTATVGQARLDLVVADPANRPALDGRLDLAGIEAGAVQGGVKLDLAGPLEALALRLSADMQTPAGPTRLSSEARLDAPAQKLALSQLDVVWKEQTLRLLSPARWDFAQGLAVDRLRLGLAEALLEVAGQISPRLDLTASLSQLDASLAKLVVPTLDAAGRLRADARLTGNPARPSGIVELEAEGMQMRTGPGRGLPPAKLTAKARLDGTAAQVDAELSAGRDLKFDVNGAVPLNPAGLFDLRVRGGMDLKLLDPLLSADGRRLRGQLEGDAALAGSLADPQLAGTIRLGGGDVQDFNLGAHLSDIGALVEAQGGTIRLAKFTAKAGPGKLTASGEVDLAKEGMPVDFSLAAQNARPLASDRLTANLDAELSLRGLAQGALAAAGSVHIREAEIRIPERMPANIAVLRVRRPGEAPPPPAAPASQREVGLDLRIDAPRQIYVRGRGLEAELGGKIHLRGSASNPQPDGAFEMRRGQFTLAGQTLVFSKGEVGFDGGSLADPSLNFLAKTTNGNVTANLAVTGTANKPKISLSSIPELPQDEVLAQLLFGRAASSLSPLELVQIGTALASLSGVTSSLGDPLETVRKGLGLDRLSVGASLEAGRYIAPGVYVGAKQGITGGGSHATVQIDVARGLKLEGSVGVGGTSTSSSSTSGTTSVGVIYQYEY